MKLSIASSSMRTMTIHTNDRCGEKSSCKEQAGSECNKYKQKLKRFSLNGFLSMDDLHAVD